MKENRKMKRKENGHEEIMAEGEWRNISSCKERQTRREDMKVDLLNIML